MSGCTFESRLDAFYDGELDAVERTRVADHVQTCPACGAMLEQMRRMSMLLEPKRLESSAAAPLDEMTRLHAAVDREMSRSIVQVDPGFWRTAVVLSGLAASVLIVASAWLAETPQSAQPMALAPIAVQTPWERVALTGRVDPLPYVGPQSSPDQSALADAHANMTDWMLHNLRGRDGQ